MSSGLCHLPLNGCCRLVSLPGDCFPTVLHFPLEVSFTVLKVNFRDHSFNWKVAYDAWLLAVTFPHKNSKTRVFGEYLLQHLVWVNQLKCVSKCISGYFGKNGLGVEITVYLLYYSTILNKNSGTPIAAFGQDEVWSSGKIVILAHHWCTMQTRQWISLVRVL